MAVAQHEFSGLARSTRAADRRSLRALGIWLALAGWAGLVVMWTTGTASRFGHDQYGVPALLAGGLFLIGWVVMVAAMMLPSSLETLSRVEPNVRRTGTTASMFLAGFFLVWTLFGLAAFIGDQVLHRVVHAVPWLDDHSWLIPAGVALLAGTAELLGRTPPRVVPADRGSALAMGTAHGVDRIRRCWPLMLFAMAAGMANPVWMVALTGVMLLELKPQARVVLQLVGLSVLALGLLVVANPAWAPLLGGG